MGARVLALQGYRYIVVHERFYPSYKLALVESVLQGLFGAPRHWPDDGLQVYAL